MRLLTSRSLVLVALLVVLTVGIFASVDRAFANLTIHIEVNRGDNSTYLVGDPLQLCWHTSDPTQVDIFDEHPSAVRLRNHVNANNSPSCLNMTVTTPTGQECFRMDVYQGSTSYNPIRVCITVAAAQGGGGNVQVHISTDRGEGSTYYVGESIHICYTLNQAIYVTLLDHSPSGGTTVITSGHDDGTGGCINGTVTTPTGQECFEIQASNSSSSPVLAHAQTCIHVQQHSSSISVSIYTDRGEGATYTVGDPITLCYTVSQPIYVTVLDLSPSGATRQILAGMDDGHGGCQSGMIVLPAGHECFKILASNTSTSSVLAQAQTCITVRPRTQFVDVGAVSVSFGKHRPDGKVVIEIWRKSTNLFIDVGVLSCPDGSAPSAASIVLTDRVSQATLGVYMLLAGPDGHWTTNFFPPPKTSDAGLGTPGFPPGAIAVYDITLTAVCADGPQAANLGEVDLEDPSGFVTDAVTHKPIVGATVVLQRLLNGTWADADPTATANGGPIMSPQLNPQSTDTNGHYQWDVAEGTWRVVVSASGYQTQTSREVSIPPPVTDLNLALQPNAGGPGSGGPTFHGKFQLTVPSVAKQ